MPAATACPEPDVLEQFAQDRLGAEHSAELRRHLGECARCRQALQQVHEGDTPGRGLSGTNAPAEATAAFDPSQPQPTGFQVTQESDFSFLAPPEGPDELGRLSHYRVLGVLGEGGMGMVFQAQDLHLERPVALKVMRPDLAANPEVKQRFLREAKATAAIKNDYIVTIYHVNEERGVPFLAMELLHGLPMDKWLARGQAPTVTQILKMGRQAALGLDAAHNLGLIHRDIKPGNLWLEARGQEIGVRGKGPAARNQGEGIGSQGEGTNALTPDARSLTPVRVKILDFGLALPMEDTVHITRSGAILGTPAFMSPEQARGLKLDPRSDLFSLGCVLYRLCTGRVPFQGETTMAVLTALAVDDPTPIRELNPDIPTGLADLVQQMLAKRPEDRPDSARVVAQRLLALEKEVGAGGQTPRSPTGILAGTADNAPTPLPALSPTVVVSPPPPQKRRWLRWVGIGIGVLFLLSLIQNLQNKTGTLALELDDPKLVVTVRQGDTILASRSPLREFQLPDGDGSLDVYEGNDRILRLAFHITRNKKTSVNLNPEVAEARKSRLPPPPPQRSFFPGLDAAWLSMLAPARLVESELRRLNPKFKGTVEATALGVKGMHMTIRGASGLVDIGPLASIPLTQLNLLVEAKGVPLLKDLSPLKDKPLESLSIPGQPVADLTPLQNMPLKELNLNGTQVASLEAIRQLPLIKLDLKGTPVRDFAPLTKMPLEHLEANVTGKYAPVLRQITSLKTINAQPAAKALAELTNDR